ncbi:MAG: group II intron maturase-specific domain-containing protein [Nitrospinota bacterium]|nr:group II intron maturase-specific domain-containing protein [Nitrospinota bacterium]MEE1569614.1 group II intron maturase-specific domain-containing protein [Alphaproteobacteria bacterium]
MPTIPPPEVVRRAGWHGPKWPKIRDDLNAVLRGWSRYFGYGSKSCSYRIADHYVWESVRHFPRRRHKVPSRRTHRFSFREVYGDLGVMLLQGARDAGPHARAMKPV